jgi:hypothetical protein
MSTERCSRIALASSASKSRLGDAVGDGEGVGDAVGDAVFVGDAVGVGEALSSSPHATTQTARASAAMRRARGAEKVVGGP